MPLHIRRHHHRHLLLFLNPNSYSNLASAAAFCSSTSSSPPAPNPKLDTSSSLTPLHNFRSLISLHSDPAVASQLFTSTASASHLAASRATMAHILHRSQNYSRAQRLLSDLALATRPNPPLFDSLVDIIHLTGREIRNSGYGVMDSFLTALTELGFLQEAFHAFDRMRELRVLPKVRSCNGLMLKCV